MNYKEQKLWDEICEFELDDDEAVYTFSDRLAKENQWTKGFALRAIDEYKKFIFLICTTHQPRTPSDEVDKVWHLHLLYTRSYWNDFFAGVLKREVHHGPTRGGPEEKEKFQNAYAQTLQHYRITFQCEPPSDLWPRDHLRQSPHKINLGIIRTLRTIL
ncbi:MAG TPA: hypothetical protein VGD65_08000 [Chryseosolibacter sp.]